MEIYMNILFYDMGSYTYQDTLFYLKQLGHTCKTVYYHFPNKFHDVFAVTALRSNCSPIPTTPL